ncbi:MAG: hypothetical protein J0H25_01130 [Rhizobiales bacterium]|nr:hypothetical protein [Hyphomicrobiales bacterium]
MSLDYFSVTAGAERDAGDAGEMTQHNLLQSTIHLYDRHTGIVVPQNATRKRVGTRDDLAFVDELSGPFRDRVEADRMGPIRAGTSRHASFGFIPFA